jgi:PadR family transcriptional regulator, regulatory protein PadR
VIYKDQEMPSKVLLQWEEVYKRGLVTFWMLLLLSQREMYAYEMRPAIVEISQQTVDVDDNSIYRALKRFTEAGLVRSDVRSSETGPPRRYFTLTPAGQALLASFIERNLLVFQSPTVVEMMQQVLKTQKRR